MDRRMVIEYVTLEYKSGVWCRDFFREGDG